MQTLVVQLPSLLGTDANAQWTLCDGVTPAQSGQSPLSQLALRKAARWVGVAPADVAAVLPCDLPPLSGNKLAAALKGALEDKLLGDEDDAILASGPAVDGRVKQAVASNREWLEKLQATSKTLNIEWAAIVPELALLAANQAYVRDEDTALVCSADGHTCALPLAAVPPGQWKQLQIKPEQWLARAASSPWNALQGEFAARTGATALGASLSTGWREGWLKPLVWGLVALVGVSVIGVNVKAWQLRQQITERKAQQVALLKRVSPNMEAVADVPLLLKRELTQLRAATGQPNPSDAEAMIAALNASLPPGDKWQRVEVKGGELTLATSIPPSGTMLQGIQARGYSATVDGAGLRMRSSQ
jgi:general secretion pathway protein L